MIEYLLFKEKQLDYGNIDLNLFTRYRRLVFCMFNHAYDVVDRYTGHLVIEATQSTGCHIISVHFELF